MMGWLGRLSKKESFARDAELQPRMPGETEVGC